jgi:hypothetical protein
MNEVVIPLKIQGIAQMKAELRELKGSLANATDPEQMTALAQQAGVLTDRIKDANEAVKVFASGSKFEQVSNGIGGIKDSLMSLDFEEAAEKSKVFATALGGIGKADIAKSIGGITSMIGTLSKAFIKLGITILMNPIFLIVAAVVAIIAVIALVLKSFGVLDDVIAALMAPINALIQGFKSMTDWLGLTSFAAEENAEKTAAANKKVSDSSKAREAQVVGDLGREIAELKAAGEETTKQEEAVSNTKIKEANIRKAEAKKELDSIKDLDGKFYDDKRLELQKQVDAENEIIKQGYSDKVVAKNAADKKESDDADKKEKEAEAKAKAAREKRIAADKASEADIAIAAKVVADSKKSLQQIELDDLKTAYKIKIAEANKFKNDTTALLDAQKIQETAIVKKYADAAKAIEDDKLAKKKEADAKALIDAIAFEDAKYLELVRLRDGQDEADKLKLQQEFDEKTAKLKEDDELFLLLRKEFQDKINAIDSNAAKVAFEAKKNIRSAEIDAAKGLVTLFAGLAEKNKKIQKAALLANAALSIAEIINNTNVGGSKEVATKGVLGLGTSALLYIKMATSIGAVIGATAKGLSALGGGSVSAPSDTGAGGGGGGATATTAVAPATGPQLFGQANTGSQINAGGSSGQNITVTAVVSETEMTATQHFINNIQQNSVL